MLDIEPGAAQVGESQPASVEVAEWLLTYKLSTGELQQAHHIGWGPERCRPVDLQCHRGVCAHNEALVRSVSSGASLGAMSARVYQARGSRE